MRLIGLLFLAFAAMLALDHSANWLMPAALGMAFLTLWYFTGREPDEVPPDRSDYLHRDQPPLDLHESSTSFDLADLAPFLERLSAHIKGGYTERVIAHIAEVSAGMKHEAERSLEYEVEFQGQRLPFHIGLFKDDAEEITIYFHTPQPLADFIDREMDSFFAESGI
ncbi:MAG: hypothetical protein ABIS50_14400 [Luteolibacter sp.]|uniref:hypothetical protein n=1 Tax=Luteolibacter sp. TaxID=1962973 RepID=UPI0032651EC9